MPPKLEKNYQNLPKLSIGLIFTTFTIISLVHNLHTQTAQFVGAQSISIRPSDFDRLIMPCYLGAGSAGVAYQSSYQSSFPQQPAVPVNSQYSSQFGLSNQGAAIGRQQQQTSAGGGYYDGTGGANGRLSSAGGSGGAAIYPPPPPAYGPLPARPNEDGQFGSGVLGQSIPRANTIDNFIALVSKIESANPRLAQNTDELIKTLLSRFRLDNYYYDVRSRTPLSTEPADRRNTDILPAILSPQNSLQAGNQNFDGFGASATQGSYMVADQALTHDEKCSMYFMLSHYIGKTSAAPTLGQLPVPQLAGPLQGQRAPNLQLQSQSQGSTNLAASSGGVGGSNGGLSNYPAQSAQVAYSAGASGPRYSGPSPSFGSPSTNQMTSFGSGISNSQPDYSGKNAYGVNSPMPTGPFGQSPFNNPLMTNARLNPGQFGAPNLASNRPALGQPPYIDGQARSKSPDDRVATEFGVVTLSGQSNAAIVLNRVLMGILGANTPAQSIRQLAAQVYPNQAALNLNTPKVDEELDPLFAVTLADLWAVSSIPKAGRPFDLRLLGDNGHWNSSFCPTIFTLERSSSVKFTTAELLGGLDGFNLGSLRRQLMDMSRNIKLSELLRMYYSPTGFKPQFPAMGVCYRYTALSTQLDNLHRQAENYARLMQLNLPTSDNEIAMSIGRLDAFREITRQAASQYVPQSICQDSPGITTELYQTNGQDSCELPRADVVAVLDSAAQANGDPFMQLVVLKLAQRLGLAARGGSSLSLMTNQLDTTGTAGGGYSLNTILRNSTNLAEIGCALIHDNTRSFQGSQVNDPTKLIELFERALVSLDSEYLTRQMADNTLSNSNLLSSHRPSTFVSTWFGSGTDSVGNYMLMNGGGPRNTGGAKVIIWFNFPDGPYRSNSLSSGPTNWTPGQTHMSSSSERQQENEYRFSEAKRYLRENFRGASILAVSPNRDSVKTFVYDQEHDIFTDVPSPSGSGSGISNDYPVQSSYASPTDLSMYSGQADQLIGKLVQRMCTIPALFQYPMCFRGPSDGAQSVGYITPGRKQYWMMAPKTFFASPSIRMAFRVEGGRLRVCFGRRPNPDETSLKNKDQQQPFQAQSISFTNVANQQQTTQAPKATSNDYYTGMEYGICKDVSPGQEIDFMVSDACYRKSISECEPFYFVIREISQPGEGDPNYMCRDDGCKRFDQAKFVMTHSGVVCSAANWATSLNWLTLIITTLITSYSMVGYGTNGLPMKKLVGFSKTPLLLFASIIVSVIIVSVQQVEAQLQAGVYDFGQGRAGEKRGNFTPSEWVGIVLICTLIIGGLALTIALCYFVAKRAARQGTPVPHNDY